MQLVESNMNASLEPLKQQFSGDGLLGASHHGVVDFVCHSVGRLTASTCHDNVPVAGLNQ